MYGNGNTFNFMPFQGKARWFLKIQSQGNSQSRVIGAAVQSLSVNCWCQCKSAGNTLQSIWVIVRMKRAVLLRINKQTAGHHAGPQVRRRKKSQFMDCRTWKMKAYGW